MKIQNETIVFRSIPELYHKEKSGLKSNTVRSINLLSEYKEFMKFYEEFNQIPNKKITIVNTATDDQFTRRLTDISPFESHFILSWESE